jgi:segregation and condensation protein B
MSDDPAKPAGEERTAETVPIEGATADAALAEIKPAGEAAGEPTGETAGEDGAVIVAPGEASDAPKGELVPPDEAMLRLAEALVFASAGPVSARALTQVLPPNADADAVIAELRARYVGRGV